MWKSIVANWRYNQGYTYTQRGKTTTPGGKSLISDILSFENIPIAFIPEDMTPKWSPEGYKLTGHAKAVIPTKFFTDNSFLPIMDDVLDSPNARYRIIGVSDYGDFPHIGVYELLLKRENYDGTERSA